MTTSRSDKEAVMRQSNILVKQTAKLVGGGERGNVRCQRLPVSAPQLTRPLGTELSAVPAFGVQRNSIHCGHGASSQRQLMPPSSGTAKSRCQAIGKIGGLGYRNTCSMDPDNTSTGSSRDSVRKAGHEFTIDLERINTYVSAPEVLHLDSQTYN